MRSPPSTDSSKNEYGSRAASARKAETGVSKSAEMVRVTGISVASRAICEKVVKSGRLMEGPLYVGWTRVAPQQELVHGPMLGWRWPRLKLYSRFHFADKTLSGRRG